jgi:ankyrin repeat protein
VLDAACKTCLHWAASQGNVAVCEYLVKMGMGTTNKVYSIV